MVGLDGTLELRGIHCMSAFISRHKESLKRTVNRWIPNMWIYALIIDVHGHQI